MKTRIWAFSLFISALCLPAWGQSYSIDWSKISGGGGASTGGVYSVSGTIGQHDAAAAMSGGNYSLTGGFWSIITVVQTTGAPMLTLTHSGNNVSISWPSSSQGWTLQQCSDLAAGSWDACGITVSNDGKNCCVTISPPAGNLFFRLVK